MSETDLKPIAVFDVCDTLYYSNTTHDFIGFAAARQFSAIKKFVYKIVNHRKSPLRYFMISLSVLTGLDFHKKINIFLLRGKSRLELDKIAKDFVEDFLGTRQIAEIHNLLDEFRKKKTCVVLCSSSIEPVVKSVAENLGVTNFVCTKLEFADDISTGKISEEITDQKITALQKHKFNAPFICAVSDNRGDASLLEASKRSVAVVHSDKGYNFWKQHSVEIIDLRK